MNTSPNSLKKITEYIRAAKNGDFSKGLAVVPGLLKGKGRDEVVELAEAVQQLVDGYRSALEKLNHESALEDQMRISHVIQSSLLPSSLPEVEGLEFDAFYKPAQEIGGDYYDFIEIDPTHLGIVVADVSGKSISGAMLMTIVRNTLRTQAMLTLSPREVLERTNTLLLPNMKLGFFVSIFYAVLDKNTKRLVCANAGHPPLLFMHSREDRHEWIKPKGIALGLLRGNGFLSKVEEQEVGLENGDFIFLHTDGVTDVVSEEGLRFGRDRIAEVAHEMSPRGACAFLGKLENILVGFGSQGFQPDDMTAVVFGRKKKGEFHV